MTENEQKIFATNFNISDATLYMWRKKLISQGLFEGVVMKAQKYVRDEFGEDEYHEKEVVQPKLYYTQKIYLAAALMLEGKQVRNILDTVPRKTIVFDFDTDIKPIIDAYFDKSMIVSAYEFYTATCELKRMIFGERV